MRERRPEDQPTSRDGDPAALPPAPLAGDDEDATIVLPSPPRPVPGARGRAQAREVAAPPHDAIPGGEDDRTLVVCPPSQPGRDGASRPAVGPPAPLPDDPPLRLAPGDVREQSRWSPRPVVLWTLAAAAAAGVAALLLLPSRPEAPSPAPAVGERPAAVPAPPAPAEVAGGASGAGSAPDAAGEPTSAPPPAGVADAPPPQPPALAGRSPSRDAVTVTAGKGQRFEVSAQAAAGGVLMYAWDVDGEVQRQGPAPSFTVQSVAPGERRVRVVVTDAGGVVRSDREAAVVRRQLARQDDYRVQFSRIAPRVDGPYATISFVRRELDGDRVASSVQETHQLEKHPSGLVTLRGVPAP